MSDHWTAKAEWMRRMGASAASWSESDQLLTLSLGAAPPVATEEDHPVKPMTADARAQYEVAERRRIALAASGGPVRRLGAKD